MEKDKKYLLTPLMLSLLSSNITIPNSCLYRLNVSTVLPCTLYPDYINKNGNLLTHCVKYTGDTFCCDAVWTGFLRSLDQQQLGKI